MLPSALTVIVAPHGVKTPSSYLHPVSFPKVDRSGWMNEQMNKLMTTPFSIWTVKTKSSNWYKMWKHKPHYTNCLAQFGWFIQNNTPRVDSRIMHCHLLSPVLYNPFHWKWRSKSHNHLLNSNNLSMCLMSYMLQYLQTV